MDELISRQAAINMKVLLEDWTGKEHEAVLVEDIEQLPSAEPKRIRGQWITDKQGFVTWSAICNKCGARTQMFDGYYNFCPNCGAKMEVTE